MKCVCGNDRFYARQVCYHSITVDGNNFFEDDYGVYGCLNPYGPYTCTECGREYDELV